MFPKKKALLVVFILLSVGCAMNILPLAETQTPSPTTQALAMVATPPELTATVKISATKTPTPAPTDTLIPATDTATIDPTTANPDVMMGSMGALRGISQYYNPVGIPLKVWQNVPVIPQATAGQEFKANIYSYVAAATLSQVQQFYTSKASSLELTHLPATGSAGSGSQAIHNVAFYSYNLTIVLTSYDNAPGHVIVLISNFH